MFRSLKRLVAGPRREGTRRLRAADFEVALSEAEQFLTGQPDSLRKRTLELIRQDYEAFVERFDDERLGVRYFLATNVVGFARYASVAVPPAPNPDPFGQRGAVGVTGELHSHLVEVCRTDDELRDLLTDAKRIDPSARDASFCAALVEGFVAMYRTRAEFWNNLRLLLGDFTEPDWYPHFVTAMFASSEDDHRKAIGLESVLERDHPAGPAVLDRLAKLLLLVVEGVEDPYSAWLAEAKP